MWKKSSGVLNIRFLCAMELYYEVAAFQMEVLDMICLLLVYALACAI